MLHFLRRIRRSLIEAGSTKRYFLYAIGEILLVMIGILLALQVNNWNEERKLRQLETEALVNLRQEFVANQKKFLEHIQPKRELLQKWRTLLLALGDPDIPTEQKPRRRLAPGSETLNVSFGILNSLIYSGKIELIQNDSLKNMLSNWEGLFHEFTEEEDVHWEMNRHYFNKYPELPMPYFDSYFDGNPRWLFHSQEEVDNLYKKAFDEIDYQNMMLDNFSQLQGTIGDALPVEERFEVIIELLDEELSKR